VLGLARRCGAPPAPLFNDRTDSNVTGGKLAMCIIDTVQATNALGRVGTNLALSARICNTSDPGDSRAECSAGINEILASLGQAASFISTASSNCANGINLHALCSGDVTGFVAALNLIGVSGSVMATSCQEAAEAVEDDVQRKMAVAKSFLLGDDYTTEDVGDQSDSMKRETGQADLNLSLLDGRRLTGQLSPGADVDRRIAIADCFFDVNQAVWYLARAGVALSESIEKCEPEWIENQTGESGKQMCSIDINGIVGSFAYTTMFISIAVSQCPVGENPSADCASSVAGLVAALSSLAAAGSSFTLTCGLEDTDDLDPGIGPG
jgi:hypothetical protein